MKLKIERSSAELKKKRINGMVHLLLTAYCFIFLYVMQGDYLCCLLNRMTNGHAGYHPLAYSVLITFVLMCVQFVAEHRCHRLPLYARALTTVPSLLLLTLVASFPPSSVFAYMACAVAAVLWLIAMAAVDRMPPKGPQPYISNLLILCIAFVFVGVVSNTDDVLHYEMRTTRLIHEGQWKKATEVGQKSLATSPRLTALRAYALLEQGQLAERLLNYPQSYGCAGLLLMPGENDSTVPASALYQELRTSTYSGGDARKFFDGSIRQSALRGNRKAQDYHLCALLLEKNIDRFAYELRLYYPQDSINARLPKLYREALVLYRQLRTHPLYLFEDNVTTTNYNDFEELRRQPTTENARNNLTRREYGNTYWWYYTYATIQRP